MEIGTNELEYLDQSRWVEWRAVEADGNPGFFKTLVEAFIQTTPPTFSSLRRCVGLAERSKACIYAHSLRSSCEVMGAKNLSDYFHSMELMLKSESQTLSTQTFERASLALEQILVELRKITES